jgi:16S rRNA (guanine966-N2)-methyltransferase
MRIVGGTLAGRDLLSPRDGRVRPTAEAVRAGMLELVGDAVPGARVLDLFAGTGALGLEALSRGARRADFVEFRPASLHALRTNVARLRLRERCRVFNHDALQFMEGIPPEGYDLAFADPPYESRILDRVVTRWKAQPFARVLVVEHARTHLLPPGGKKRSFGETSVSVYRVPAPKADPR